MSKPYLAAAALVVAVAATPLTHDAEVNVGAPAETSAQQPAAISVVPWTHPSLYRAARESLAEAVALAVRQLRAHPACRGLFEAFGEDAEKILARSRYYAATVEQEQRVCRATYAFTTVRGRKVGLCRSFHSLPRERAAVIVLHEALHHAGLNERPPHPDGMDTWQINKLVARSCGLESLHGRRAPGQASPAGHLAPAGEAAESEP